MNEENTRPTQAAGKPPQSHNPTPKTARKKRRETDAKKTRAHKLRKKKKIRIRIRKKTHPPTLARAEIRRVRLRAPKYVALRRPPLKYIGGQTFAPEYRRSLTGAPVRQTSLLPKAIT